MRDPKAQPTRIPRSLSMWCFAAFCWGLNVGLPPLIEVADDRWGLSMDQEILCLIGLAGIVCGECCFVTLIAGLCRRLGWAVSVTRLDHRLRPSRSTLAAPFWASD